MLSFHIFRLITVYLLICLSFSFTIPTFGDVTQSLSKRVSALYTLWNSIPGGQKAAGDSALYFSFPRDADNAWGITYLYGCTAIMISDPGDLQDPQSKGNIIVGHFQEIGAGNCINLDNEAAVKSYISAKLEPETDLFDPNANTRVDLLYDGCKANSKGIAAIKSFLTGTWLIPANQIRDRGYTAGRGTGQGSPNPDYPTGLAVVRWEAGTAPAIGSMEVYVGNNGGEDPVSAYVYRTQ